MDMVTKYMGELMAYTDNTKILLYATLGAVIITFIFYLIFKEYRFVKYLPGSIIVLLALYNLLLIFDSITEKSSLKNLELFLILAVSGFSSIFFALLIGIYTKQRKVNRKRKVKKEGA